MKIVFVSNYMNKHQAELAEELYRLTEGSFKFIACEQISRMRLDFGYEDMNKSFSYIVRPYEDEDQAAYAKKLVRECDVMLFGSGNNKYITERMKLNKLTIKYSERLFKKGIYRSLIPQIRKRIYDGYTVYKNSIFYVLCSSAYTSYDLSLCGFPANKCFKWGYFPETAKLENIDTALKQKNQGDILWVGRFLGWKHPEMIIRLAEALKASGRDAHITMVGDGEIFNKISLSVKRKGIEDILTLTGSVPSDKVNEYMKKASLCIMTSDFHEGWGAVVNEAMSNGCAVVASHAMGSVPFLIKDMENGLIFKNRDSKDMIKKVFRIIDDSGLRMNLGRNAYKTIADIWNPKHAAECLIRLIENGMQNDGFEDICGTADVFKNNWYKK